MRAKSSFSFLSSSWAVRLSRLCSFSNKSCKCCRSGLGRKSSGQGITVFILSASSPTSEMIFSQRWWQAWQGSQAGKLVSWPGAQSSQKGPVTPGLHKHSPVKVSQAGKMVPSMLQSQAERRMRSFCCNQQTVTLKRTKLCLHMHCISGFPKWFGPHWSHFLPPYSVWQKHWPVIWEDKKWRCPCDEKFIVKSECIKLTLLY